MNIAEVDNISVCTDEPLNQCKHVIFLCCFFASVVIQITFPPEIKYLHTMKNAVVISGMLNLKREINIR